MALEEMRQWLYGCSHCGTCKDVLNIFVPACPSGEKYQLESYYPSGRVLLARGVLEGVLSLDDEEIRHRIYACTGCLSCEQQCGVYHHQHIFEIIQTLRTEAVTRGLLNPGYMTAYYGLRGEDNVFGKLRKERGDWTAGLDVKYATREEVDVLYHAGCLLSYEPELWPVSRSIISLLQTAGLKVGVMGAEENCCGGRAYEMGYLGEFTKYAQHNIETFNNLGIATVITACSDGYSYFKNLYPKTGLEMKYQVEHTVEYLYNLVTLGRLRLNRQVNRTVTYHDPCHLGRHMPTGVYDSPRELLARIPGLALVEMERNRENAWCCGAGAGVSQADPDLALWAAGERLQEAMKTGATAIVTSCPWCEKNFLDAARHYHLDIEILDVAQLVALAV